MACLGGCIVGSGQPFLYGDTEKLLKRMKGLHDEDRSKEIRRSHQNRDIIKIYDEFFGEPGSKKAEKYLHTRYVMRESSNYK